MATDRLNDLLLDAAGCFDNGTSPFTPEWLSDRGVDSEECARLSEIVGVAVRYFAKLPKDQQVVAFVIASNDAGEMAQLQRIVDHQRLLRRAGV